MNNRSDREIAVSALMDIIEKEGFNNIVLKRILDDENLDRRDRAFITEIVNGSLRNLILIDYIIDEFSKTPTKKINKTILNIFRISIYQIMFMDRVPDSAAVNEGVNLARKLGYGGLSGYVNGVLRNIVRNKDKIKYPKDKKEYISVKYSYPLWLINYFSTFMDIKDIEEYCKATSVAPEVSLCVNTNKINREDLIKELELETMTVNKGGLEDNLSITDTSDISKSQAFIDGKYHIMDESSMFAVISTGVKSGDSVLDLCAAPGGKSFYMAYRMENNGSIISNDLYEQKIDRLEKNKKRLGIDIIDTNIGDAIDFNNDWEEKFDIVLLDAPCSGLGLISKKPDIKYTKSLKDIKELSKLQRKLLDTASKYPKIGSRLIYSTCTVSKMENEDNIKWFLDNYPYELENLENIMGTDYEKALPQEDGYLKLYPNIHGTDGFFIACLKRIGE